MGEERCVCVIDMSELVHVCSARSGHVHAVYLLLLLAHALKAPLEIVATVAASRVWSLWWYDFDKIDDKTQHKVCVFLSVPRCAVLSVAIPINIKHF